jgi:hypothetical protein
VLDAINQGRGVNELLAINDHEFLVLDRDNRMRVPTPPNESQGPNLKQIYKIDLNKPGLTDVDSLPATAAELGDIVPVTKTKFLDLLDPDYKVDVTHTIKDVIAEKIEALAWGPDLPDGRHLLYVVSDNDLFPGCRRRSTRSRSMGQPAARTSAIGRSAFQARCSLRSRSRRSSRTSNVRLRAPGLRAPGSRA